VFADPTHFHSKAVWLAVVAYAVQIYCDFSGYTDMAIGAAHMLGYKLARNFNIPYVSANVSEFWRRWHISLSSWLRDYLFIPLGGSRGGTWQTHRNLLITMTLSGLWHGASWTFVVWGVLHGVLLIVHKLFQGFCKTRPILDRVLQSAPGTLLRVALTFLSVCVGWVFFRATTFGLAAGVLGRMAMWRSDASTGPLPTSGIVLTMALVAVCHVIRHFELWPRWQRKMPAPILGASYALAVTLALMLAPSGSKPFIYFQF
jgi:alginate O-acetyltransferase complex protein AlgI